MVCNVYVVFFLKSGCRGPGCLPLQNPKKRWIYKNIKITLLFPSNSAVPVNVILCNYYLCLAHSCVEIFNVYCPRFSTNPNFPSWIKMQKLVEISIYNWLKYLLKYPQWLIWTCRERQRKPSLGSFIPGTANIIQRFFVKRRFRPANEKIRYLKAFCWDHVDMSRPSHVRGEMCFKLFHSGLTR